MKQFRVRKLIYLHCLVTEIFQIAVYFHFFIIAVFLLSQSLQFLLETCKILVIGAGGLGCELLKNLVGNTFNLC